MAERITVAIINTTPDTVSMLREAVQAAGFMVVSCFTQDIRDGQMDFDAFMRLHRPRVIVYDLAPPYERNFQLFQHVRAMDAVKDSHFVVTSVNPKHVVGMVGRDQHVYEVVDREEDLLNIVQAVKEASRARETR